MYAIKRYIKREDGSLYREFIMEIPESAFRENPEVSKLFDLMNQFAISNYECLGIMQKMVGIIQNEHEKEYELQ